MLPTDEKWSPQPDLRRSRSVTSAAHRYLCFGGKNFGVCRDPRLLFCLDFTASFSVRAVAFLRHHSVPLLVPDTAYVPLQLALDAVFLLNNEVLANRRFLTLSILMPTRF